jgi:hypothetical protein
VGAGKPSHFTGGEVAGSSPAAATIPPGRLASPSRGLGQTVRVLGLDAINLHRAMLRAVRGAGVVNPFAGDTDGIAAVATLGLQQPCFLLRRRARRAKA